MLANLLVEQLKNGLPSHGALLSAVPAGSVIAPVSFVQRRLWFLDQLTPGAAFYNVPLIFEFEGPLDVDALEQAIGEIVRRHDVLRTTCPADNGEPVQHIAPPSRWSLPAEDLSGSPAETRHANAEARILEEIRRPFELSRGPLFRAQLFRLTAERHVLAATVHHIVFDAWSTGVLFREMRALYAAFSEGQPSPLPELAVQYSAFAEEQRAWLAGDGFATQLAYWKQHLRAPLPTLAFPADRHRPAMPSVRGHRHEVPLDEPLIKSLQGLSGRSGVTFFVTALAAYATYLNRITGQDDVLIGVPTANRTRPEFESLIGFFVNTLPLRLDVSGDPTFVELLARVKHVAFDGLAHRDLPFERIVEELNPGRGLGEVPMLQTMLALDNTPYAVQGGVEVGPLTIRRRRMSTLTAKVDVMLSLPLAAKGRVAAIETSDDLFDPPTTARMALQYRRLLEGIVERPDAPISALPLLPDDERRLVADVWSTRGRRTTSEATLVSLFEDQVARTPDGEAITCGPDAVTYRALNDSANRIAGRLRALGVRPDDRVAIMCDRSWRLAAGLIGILKAGAAYVPLDPLYPAERLAFIAADANARVLVTRSAFGSSVPAGDRAVLFLDDLDADAAHPGPDSAGNPTRVTAPDNLAYVLYTSGSTGQPKGVAIEHRSVVNLIGWALAEFSAAERAVMLASTSINFDLSVFELFLTWSGGGLVVLVDNLLMLSRAPARDRVTFVNTVPSVMTEFLRLDELPAGVRVVALAGEPLHGALVDRLYACSSVQRVFDLYGPTEATVYATGTLRVPNGRATIGGPIAGATAYVLDGRRQPVPIGVTGELYLGGAGLAREYLGRPDLTAERFQDHPFEGSGARVFRTGDLARWLPDGTLEFQGRRDHQIKLRGFRIELGEIESQLATHAAVRAALVVVRDDPPEGPRLVAYVVLSEPCGDDELVRHLERRLPGYMIPAVFVSLAALPRLPNGKIDRSALPAPARSSATARVMVPPRTSAEETIAAIWRDLLGLSEIGVDDNFFQLGGHSLLATQVISRMRTAFEIPIELRVIFETPTIAGLAELAHRSRGEGGLASRNIGEGGLARPIPQVAPDRDLPLSFAQQRLWFLDRWNAGNGLYNIPTAFTLSGALDVGALEQSLRLLVERHAALRTVFPTAGGRPAHSVLSPADLNLSVVDVADRGSDPGSVAVQTLVMEEARRGFDLARGPLVRAVLFRLGETEHVFVLTLHHIVGDAWSLAILFRELSVLYRAIVGGTTPMLPPIPISYPDFAAWQRDTFQGELLERHLAYWTHQLRPPRAVLQLPFDRARPVDMRSDGDRVDLSLPPDTAKALTVFCRRERVTPFVTLLAVFQVLLHRWGGQDDLLIGTPIANRTRRELEDVVGCFVNTTVMRGTVGGDPSFRELVERVRQTSIDAQNYQELPFEQLIDALRIERSTSYSPLFQVMFVTNEARAALALPGVSASQIRVNTGYSKFDLTGSFTIGQDALRGSFEFSTEIFDRKTVEAMAADFARLTAAALAGGHQRVSALPMTAGSGVKPVPRPTTGDDSVRPTAVAPRPTSIQSAAMPGIEATLSKLWSAILETPGVGVDDNFFELGGNSFLAVRLFAGIEDAFGIKLPLSTLFQQGTIRAQATLLAATVRTDLGSPIVAIQPNGTQRPFFLVHGIGAEVLGFSTLVKHVGLDQPIFGLRPPTQEPAFFSTVENVAAAYVQAIRATDPNGPYRIGGYSGGGRIAYEMAQQLQTAGAQVEALVMIDSEAPGSSRHARTPAVLWRMLKNAAYWTVDDDFFRTSSHDRFRRLASRFRTFGHSVDIRDRLGVWRFPESTRALLEAQYRMLLAYRPQLYRGSVVVLRARTFRLSFRGTPDLGWAALAQGGIRMHVIPGAHDNILTEPRVSVLAAALVDSLRES
jgi:amino acid adenylation domain-containing protein